MRILFLLMLCGLYQNSQAFLFVDPVNLVQNTLTASNSVNALINQVQGIHNQLENYQRNIQNLRSFHYQDIGHSIRQLDNITRQGQSISYSMQNADQQFKRYYPDYSHQQTTNYQQAYHRWNQTTMTTLSNSLQAIGSNTQSVQNEDQLMQQLKRQSQTAQGRTQLLQTANEMSAENVRQLESLKHLIAAQSNAQTAYMAQQVSKDAYQDKSLDEVVQQTPSDFPRYNSQTGFGTIK